MLTKNAIRAGCGRGELAYDYVDLGCEEIVHKARPRLQHEKICNGQGTHGVGVPYTVEYPTMAVSNARRERPPLVWVRLADSTEPRGAAAQALLAQPAALVRAALFLRDAHNWRRGGRARAGRRWAALRGRLVPHRLGRGPAAGRRAAGARACRAAVLL